MSSPWSYDEAPDIPGEGEVLLMEGTTFCLSDSRGDVGSRRASGLFVRDTRVLSVWRLVVRDHDLEPLCARQDAPYSATYLLHATDASSRGAPDLLVSRERFVGEGMREQLTIRNNAGAPTRLLVDLEADADFADIFEVKEGREWSTGRAVSRSVDARLELTLGRDDAAYATAVEPAPGTLVTEDGLHWLVELPGHGSWATSVLVVPRLGGQWLVPHHPPGTPVEHAEPARRHREFRRGAPRLTTPDAGLAHVLERSIEDLATLRIFDPDRPSAPVIAAGAPWFMALFGRDSLLTSMMVMPFDAGLALGTLTTLGSYAGRRHDPTTEEQRGRIPHEVRFGPAGTLALGGQNVYYGSADSTPLFVVALGELARWQPSALSAELVEAADRGLDWMLDHGDPDGDGFIEYARATDRGLVNQGWKDSWDGINFADGSMPEPPIALAEVQAYAYAAYLARAEIADVLGDDATARRWCERAAGLKRSFNEAFWLPDRGWYAVALDRDKRPVDALTSNNGHCLWSGIVDALHADQVAAHLLSPPMWSGWGIRTLAQGMGAYNPMSYHNGSVWPHDTAICVAGLLRYGQEAAAQQVAAGLLDAATSLGGRLPELFAGFDRQEIPVPVPYPSACSPQAWASAAPLFLLSSLLGLEPTSEGLDATPYLPERLLPLWLRHVSCRGTRYDIEVDHHGWSVHESDRP